MNWREYRNLGIVLDVQEIYREGRMGYFEYNP